MGIYFAFHSVCTIFADGIQKTTDMLNLETIALQVCDIAREAGAYIKKERASFSVEKVERKHAHDYVSYVDKGSEQLIVKALRALLPEAGFITEEGTAKGDDVGCLKDEEGCTWVVDPLDGTTNFIHGFAPYAVSIALIRGREILVGVVYEICADECFYAWKGGGAFMDGGCKMEEVSPRSEGCRCMWGRAPSTMRCCACSCRITAMPISPSSSNSYSTSTETWAASA